MGHSAAFGTHGRRRCLISGQDDAIPSSAEILGVLMMALFEHWRIDELACQPVRAHAYRSGWFTTVTAAASWLS